MIPRVLAKKRTTRSGRDNWNIMRGEFLEQEVLVGPEGSDPGAAAELESRLGYTFKNAELLDRALTHRSFAHEFGEGRGVDYEHLEFLGDSLLGFIVSAWLCRKDPDATEGTLTRRRQTVVRSETLAEAARAIGLGESLRLSRGEESSGGREKASLLADSFEAVLGAIYIDGGLRPARSFVVRHLRSALRESEKAGAIPDDYKTRLQEAVQARTRQTPRYRIVSTRGPAHQREFEVEVLVGDEIRGSGTGRSRKLAEQEAARVALRRLREVAG
jgi:ribonuclease-3